MQHPTIYSLLIVQVVCAARVIPPTVARWPATLNWFEGERLYIGSRDNPAHVAAWERWNRELGRLR